MRNKFPIRTEARKAKRRQRFTTENPCCVLCGATVLESLIPVTPDWLEKRGIPFGPLEAHHVVGHVHDPKLTVPLCRNCHAVATEDLLCAGVSMKPAADRRLLAEMRLEASATFLERLALSMRGWSKELPMEGTAGE
jgi:hypothetical protein